MNLSWGKFTLYIIIGYAIYYIIVLGLDFFKSRKNTSSKTDEEIMDIECLIEDVPQVVESITVSEELKDHNEKKNYFNHSN